VFSAKKIGMTSRQGSARMVNSLTSAEQLRMERSAPLERSASTSSATWRVGTKAFAIAALLWLASNVFVTGIATVTTWEGGASYKRMADLCRWDCGWYASVLQPGYSKAHLDTGAANWVFCPLFPLTAYPLHTWFKLSLYGSMVLAGKLELLLAIYGFLLMFGAELETTTDFLKAGALVAFNPYVIYAHAGYAEPLYFAAIAFAFYFVNRRQWVFAGMAGGMASATRVVGVVFAASYLVSWLRSAGRRSWWRKLELNAIMGLLLCPLGTALFMLYLYHVIGDALALQHGHVAWGRVPGNPLGTLWVCLIQGRWSRLWGMMMIAGWLLSAWLFKLRKFELGVYLASALLLATLSPMGGYWGVARYVWWQPPFLYAIYRLLRRSDAAWVVYLVFASGMAAFMVMEWFSGHNFVV